MSDAIVVFDDVAATGVLRLRPGKNLKTGEASLRAEFGELTSLEVDLLTLASSVFACDLAFKRGERETITRKISITIPVVNLAVFNSVRDDIRYALFRLSHDAWDIQFTKRDGEIESTTQCQVDGSGKVLLFSGGLDSFSAALQLADCGENIQLVSHITANPAVLGAQETLFQYLDEQHPNVFSRIAVRVGGRSSTKQGYPFPASNTREDTQRTRSFVFLVLAGIVARRKRVTEVVVIAENGQLAMHLPLTAARISAFSTHTAHPEFIHCMAQILSRALRFPINITNPFQYLTKAEVVKDAVTDHLDMVPHAVSCWMTSRVTGTHNHCGSCIPCLIRRIAIEANEVQLQEYRRDLFSADITSLGPDDNGKRNLVELAEFIRLFESTQANAALEEYYPELSNEHIDSNQAIEMYRRFAHEALLVFGRYPSLKALVE